MKLISIFFILLVVIGLILYFYLNTKDTFDTSPSAVVDIIYTVEVVGTTAYKFKDNNGTYLKSSGTNNDLNPTIILEEGKTYEFVNVSNRDVHPFIIQDKNKNFVGNKSDGNITLTATSSESPYNYICGFHNEMTGFMRVTTPTQPSTPLARLVIELPQKPVSTFPKKMTRNQYDQILSLQTVLKAKIDSIITKFNSFLTTNVINYSSTSTDTPVEPFIDTIKLNSESFPEIKSYAEIYNKNIALLDDPNELKSKTFDSYIYMQNNKITKLYADLLKLQTKIQSQKKITPSIKSFKSMNTSQAFNIELYNEQNPNNSSDYPNYLIYGNNGCLEYEKQNGDQSSKWKFTSCDSNNNNQKFVSSKIDNLETYNSFINDDINQDRKLKNNTSTLFGFNVINPLEAKDQCLQLNNDGLTVMPCTLDFSQRFRESYTTVLP